MNLIKNQYKIRTFEYEFEWYVDCAKKWLQVKSFPNFKSEALTPKMKDVLVSMSSSRASFVNNVALLQKHIFCIF